MRSARHALSVRRSILCSRRIQGSSHLIGNGLRLKRFSSRKSLTQGRKVRRNNDLIRFSTMGILQNHSVQLSGRSLEGDPIDLKIENGIIREIIPAESISKSRYVVPGFFDIQVNGFSGRD